MGKEPQSSHEFTIGGLGSADDDRSSAVFLQESNELKIEKLGNRVTIISVLIPCIIFASLFFIYMDIKERLVSVHDTGQTEVLGVAEDLDSKLNAMTVDLAGVKHRLETTANALQAKTASLGADKADKSEVEKELSRIEANLADKTSKTVKKAVLDLEDTIKQEILPLGAQKARISEALAKMAGIEGDLTRQTEELKGLIKAVNEALKGERAKTAALGAKLTDQGETLALLRKELSLVKIKTDTLEQTFIDRKVLDRELELLNKKIDQKRDIEKSHPKIEKGSIDPMTKPSPSPRQPKPPANISEKDLLQ